MCYNCFVREQSRIQRQASPLFKRVERTNWSLWAACSLAWLSLLYVDNVKGLEWIWLVIVGWPCAWWFIIMMYDGRYTD